MPTTVVYTTAAQSNFSISKLFYKKNLTKNLLILATQAPLVDITTIPPPVPPPVPPPAPTFITRGRYTYSVAITLRVSPPYVYDVIYNLKSKRHVKLRNDVMSVLNNAAKLSPNLRFNFAYFEPLTPPAFKLVHLPASV